MPQPPRLPGDAVAADRPPLDARAEAAVFRAAVVQVAGIVQGEPERSLAAALGEVASLPLYGAFVSLKLHGRLRACCGHLAWPLDAAAPPAVPLAEAVGRAAVRAARDDPRFPAIAAAELRQLDAEVWLLWGLQPIRARGAARAAAVVIGRHGLQIAQGDRRGLLLPGVAVEHGLDSPGFLGQVCLKAGLSAEAWRDDAAQLWTFEGYAIRGPVGGVVAAAGLSPPPDTATGPSDRQLAALVAWCRGNLRALLHGATPDYYFPGGYETSVNGAVLAVGAPGEAARFECSRLAPHADLPLQATLYQLVAAAAEALQRRRTTPAEASGLPLNLAVLADLAPLGTAGDPDLPAALAAVEPQHHAVLAIAGPDWAWVYDREQPPGQSLEEAVARVAGGGPRAVQVLRARLRGTEPRLVVSRVAAEPAESVGDGQARLNANAADIAANAEPTAATADQTAASADGSATSGSSASAAGAGAGPRPARSASAAFRPAVATGARVPAVAGTFYPARPAEVARMLDEMLPAAAATARYPAVLAPHAGWVYSGRLAAEVLARVAIPSHAIVLAPKHRPGGAAWAVAPYSQWLIPGGAVAGDPGLARQLAERIDRLECDAVPHAEEHAIEVQLPILARLAPAVRVVGLTFGGGELAALLRCGAQLAAILADLPEPPLLVISSDLHHGTRADETERLDRLALEAIGTLDPARIYDTVTRHDIGMCGMAPCVVALEALRRLQRLERCELLEHTTSAAVAGDRGRVVGYAGMLFAGPTR